MKRLIFVLIITLFSISTVNAQAHHKHTGHKKTIKHHRHIVVNHTHAKQKLKLIAKKTRHLNDLKQIFTHNKNYDDLFKLYMSVYLPGVDHHVLKALCTVESELKPNSKHNPTSKGLCQLTRGTYRETNRHGHKVPIGGIYKAKYNIHAAANYLYVLNKFWKIHPGPNKLKIILASYNAGQGNILRAKRLCGNTEDYFRIMQCLPHVTGRDNATITREYVKNILHLAQI